MFTFETLLVKKAKKLKFDIEYTKYIWYNEDAKR